MASDNDDKPLFAVPDDGSNWEPPTIDDAVDGAFSERGDDRRSSTFEAKETEETTLTHREE